jgi:hypothetical protein
MVGRGVSFLLVQAAAVAELAAFSVRALQGARCRATCSELVRVVLQVVVLVAAQALFSEALQVVLVAVAVN